MIPPVLADIIRSIDATLSLVLVVSCCYAVRLSRHADQRVRFALFGVFAVLLTAGHVTVAGQPASWRLPVLAAAVALAAWSTIKYVRRELGERRHGR